MTQKGNLFKGQKKMKTIPPNRHGKLATTRKGKRFKKPSKETKEMDADRVYEWSDVSDGLDLHVSDPIGQVELSKFINHCNEVKAATLANKEGGQLSIVKVDAPESTRGKS